MEKISSANLENDPKNLLESAKTTARDIMEMMQSGDQGQIRRVCGRIHFNLLSIGRALEAQGNAREKIDKIYEIALNIERVTQTKEGIMSDEFKTLMNEVEKLSI